MSWNQTREGRTKASLRRFFKSIAYTVPGSPELKERYQISSPFGFQLSHEFSAVEFCPETVPKNCCLPVRSTTVKPTRLPVTRLAKTTRAPSGETRIIHKGHGILST